MKFTFESNTINKEMCPYKTQIWFPNINKISINKIFNPYVVMWKIIGDHIFNWFIIVKLVNIYDYTDFSFTLNKRLSKCLL